MSSYVAEINERNLDNAPSEAIYPHLFQLILEHNDDKADIHKI